MVRFKSLHCIILFLQIVKRAAGQPNNAASGQLCSHVYFYNNISTSLAGALNDWACSDALKFICEVFVKNIIRISNI